MTGPRDTPRFAVPVDYSTGEPLTEAQIGRLARLDEAYQQLQIVMHVAEGTDPGNPQYSSRRMAIAATQIELGMMMARRAALEAK